MNLVTKLALRNLVSDWFGTLCGIIGVALGTATVNVVLVLDTSTRYAESRRWSTNPDLDVDLERTVGLRGYLASGAPSVEENAKEETHENYQVMRSAIRLGSLSSFAVGALIVFFTFGVVVERRKREIALLRSLGALPGQVARIIILEAVIVGALGAAVGLFLVVPMAGTAAMMGITTTGRSSIRRLHFPLQTMLMVSAIGASCALLGIVRPALRVLRLDVASTLSPRFLSGDDATFVRRTSGLTLVALPFMAMVYVVMRPFFQEVLPSLAFFVLECGLVVFAFMGVLMLIPEVIRHLGGSIARLLPSRPAAARLLVVRRVQKMGHELAWSISGLMLVFGLLLSLHIVTRSLELEVVDWGQRSIRPYTFVYSRWRARIPERLLPKFPSTVARADYSGRSPWPNSLHAVSRDDLVATARATGKPELVALSERLEPGKVILSRMMARRFGLEEGDALEVTNRNGSRRLTVAAVTDDVGYVPAYGPYRNTKTYGVIDAGDYDLIRDYAPSMGAALAFVDSAQLDAEQVPWMGQLARLDAVDGVRVDSGPKFERDRVAETDNDFVIFDVILLLTTVLASIGIANNLVLSAHGRRREVALYRVLGMTSAQVRQLFLMEGVFIGMFGGPLAVALGIPLGWAGLGALELVSAFKVRFDLPFHYVVFTVAGAILVAFTAALYPANRAASSSSAESVHYE